MQQRWSADAQEALYVALAGPLSGSNANNGLEMVRGVQLYLDQVNAQGGVNGRPIELLLFDDQSDPEIARQQAQKIVEQYQPLVVFGHYSSATTQAAAEVYRQAGIPAITGSATADSLTDGSQWYFRTIFNNR